MGTVQAAAQLKEAIESLYAGAAARPDVNHWLLEFSASPTAWGACLDLLDISSSADVRFFCANLLLTKVRNEWGKLTAEQKQQLPGLISQRLQVLLPQPGVLPCLRLCMVLATIAAYNGGEQAAIFIAQALQLALDSAQAGQAVLQCGLQMLATYAEEAEGLERARRHSAVEASLRHQRAVLSLVESILTLQLAPPGSSPPLLVPALSCLQAWLKLDPRGASSTAISPGQMRATHPALYAALLSLLVSEQAEAAEKAAEVAGDLLGPGMVGGDGGVADTAALEAAVRGLLSQRERVCSPSPSGSSAAVSIARVAAAVAARDPDLLCKHAELAGLMAEMMVGGTAAGGRKVAEAAVEYFVALNVVPVGERLGVLREEAFAQLVQALFRHVCYGAGFSSWEEAAEDDEDMFGDFREQVVGEALEAACSLMGVAFLRTVLQMLEGAPTWQVAEGALFYLLAVAEPARSKALSKAAPDNQEGLQTQAATSAALSHMFGLLCTPAPCSRHLANPYACQTAARVLGAYSSWLAAESTAGRGPPLEGALRLLLAALPQPLCSRHAAQSFRSVCARCTPALAQAGVLYPLMDAAMAVVAPDPPAGQVAAAVAMEGDDRGLVVEGLARVVAQADAGAVVEAGLKLLRPFIVRAQSVTAAGGAVGPPQLALLAAEMKLVAAAIKHMDFPPGQPGVGVGVAHPAVRLLEGAWPLMSALSQSPLCRQTPQIVEALCEVYQRFLMSAKSAAKPVLRLLISCLLEMFSAAPQPPLLAPLGTITELFGQVLSEPEVAQLQAQALSSTTSTTFALMQASGSSLAQHGDLLGAQLSLAKRYLTFSRPLLAASPALPPLFRAAVSALTLRDKEPLAPALALLSQLLSSCSEAHMANSDPEYTALGCRVEEYIRQGGQELAGSLVGALTDTCPRPLWRQLAGALHALLAPGSCRAAAAAWLQAALASPSLPALQANMVASQDCQRFTALLLRHPSLARGKFDMLVSDFAAMCRGEAGADTLLAYEM